MKITLQKILNELEFIDNEKYWRIIALIGESQILLNKVTNSIIKSGVDGFYHNFKDVLCPKDIIELKARIT